MVNDPIADMLVRIKNAGDAGNPTTQIPYSDMKMRIANILLEEGYVASVVKKTGKSAHQKFIEVGILYDGHRRPRLSGLTRVSRPSRRVYSGVVELKPVNQGHGIMILSTPKGVLTDKTARKEHVGGEVICKIW